MAKSIGEEGRNVAAHKVAELVALSWEDLDRYDLRTEKVTLPSGRTYRVKSRAYWDMDAWQSDMRVSVKVYATQGLRRYWPLTAHAVRGGGGFPEHSSLEGLCGAVVGGFSRTLAQGG